MVKMRTLPQLQFPLPQHSIFHVGKMHQCRQHVLGAEFQLGQLAGGVADGQSNDVLGEFGVLLVEEISFLPSHHVLPPNFFVTEQEFRNTKKHQETSRNIRKHQETSRNIKKHQETSGNIRKH